jgi:hypothetical protein
MPLATQATREPPWNHKSFHLPSLYSDNAIYDFCKKAVENGKSRRQKL